MSRTQDGKTGAQPTSAAAQFHESHRAAWDLDAADASRDAVHESWMRTDTADYWRHARMYEPVRAFAHRPGLTWVTIGDGRYGLDSVRIKRLGFPSVLPTDIGEGLLKQAKATGLIEAYAVENAEALSFDDESFDMVFCKESYHHFPRPSLAVYEMIRVARWGVVLIEPRDYVIDHGPTRSIGPAGLIEGLKVWLRGRSGVLDPVLPVQQRYVLGDEPAYEESGNYVYTISARELEKIALGINLPAVAFKGLNDAYLEGGETEPASDKSSLFGSMKSAIADADNRTQGGRGATNMLMAVLFKASPDEATKRFFSENDWFLKQLPRNPHI